MDFKVKHELFRNASKKVKAKCCTKENSTKTYIDEMLKKYPELKNHCKEEWFKEFIQDIVDLKNSYNFYRKSYYMRVEIIKIKNAEINELKDKVWKSKNEKI